MVKFTFSVFIFFLFIKLPAVAQSQDTTYFNRQWKKTIRDSALFFRPPIKKEYGVYHVKDYYINKQMQMDGYFSSLEPEIREGYFIYYDSAGFKQNEGSYAVNKRVGNWKYYYQKTNKKAAERTFETDTITTVTYFDSLTGGISGKGQYLHGKPTGKWTNMYGGNGNFVQSITCYKEGKINGHYERYDPLSHEKTEEGNFENNEKNGLWKFYNKKKGWLRTVKQFKYDKPDGQVFMYDSLGNVILEGNYDNGLRTGEWCTYYPASHQLKAKMFFKNDHRDGALVTYFRNGNIKRHEIWAQKEMINGQCYNEDGTTMAYYPFQENPSFPGDLEAYTETYIRYPYVALIAKSEGIVQLSFYVETDGSISDITIDKEVSNACNEAAMRFLNEMPAWNPGKLDGVPDRMECTIKITFRVNDGSIKVSKPSIKL